MEFLITFFMLLLFSTFFYLIWLWYLALLPLAVLIFMLSHWFKNIFKWIKFEILREKRSLILIRLLTIIGLSWIMFFIWIKEISVYLALLTLNIFLWLWSHVFKYEDGKSIFEIWTRLIIIIILWSTLFSTGFSTFFETFSLLSCLMLWVYAFLQFIIWIFFPTEEKRMYQIVVLWIIAIWSVIIKKFYPAERIMSVCLGMISLLYLWIYIVQKWEMPTKQPAMISVRRILAGERIFKKLNIPHRKINLHEWLDNRPVRFSRFLEFINIWLLIFLLVFFFIWIFSSSKIYLWLRYRLWIAVFLVNVLLLKRIEYDSAISRFTLALIVNFILYSILLISWSSIEWVFPILVIRWFLCQIAIFYVDTIKIKIFSNKDYQYRTVATFIASICNIILLCHINLPTPFLFALICLYTGIELFILFYIVRFLRDRQEKIENAEKEGKKAIQELVNENLNNENY